MKVTIDVPAPSQLLELVSRLRTKNRNYKLQLKQLGRAHFISKRMLEMAQLREQAYLERIGKLVEANTRVHNELAYAQEHANGIHGCMIPDEPVFEPVDKRREIGYIGSDIFDHPI